MVSYWIQTCWTLLLQHLHCRRNIKAARVHQHTGCLFNQPQLQALQSWPLLCLLCHHPQLLFSPPSPLQLLLTSKQLLPSKLVHLFHLLTWCHLSVLSQAIHLSSSSMAMHLIKISMEGYLPKGSKAMYLAIISMVVYMPASSLKEYLSNSSTTTVAEARREQGICYMST